MLGLHALLLRPKGHEIQPQLPVRNERQKRQCKQSKRATKARLAVFGNNFNNNLNANNNLNNNGRFAGIAQAAMTLSMKTYKKLWTQLVSYENLELAYRKASKGKTKKSYVKKFENSLKENLLQLSAELILQTYKPQPLKIIIIKDPKTRKICKSEFRDRVVHHALCNSIGLIFEKRFIYDSYANIKQKGSLKALERFDYFKRKVSKNNTRQAFVLKADVKHYFECVDHKILIKILGDKIKDEKVIWLIKRILDNYGSYGKGMPLGNLTSQFFANVYLNELDQFVKHTLKAEYYVRYVDDFVVMHNKKETLKDYKYKVNIFLRELGLELHEGKSKIIKINQGVCFLGFRAFYHHKLLKKSNIRKNKRKLLTLKVMLQKKVY